jgi:hypothetical protein
MMLYRHQLNKYIDRLIEKRRLHLNEQRDNNSIRCTMAQMREMFSDEPPYVIDVRCNACARDEMSVNE